ncbi:MAG: type II toxin-antitoxin system VapC family toxin [bacterium]
MAHSYFLDTDIIIDKLRGSGAGVAVFDELIKIPTIATTMITRFELLCGESNPQKTKIILGWLELFTIHTLTGQSVAIAATIYKNLKSKGQLIGVADILLASIVIEVDGILVTKNRNDFERIEGLRLF